jgi:transcriptional regulator with XRE-family HTH domain
MDKPEVLRVVAARRMLADGSARQRRVAAGLSLRDVAEALGVDTATVWRWETHRRAPRREAALLYADLLEELREEQVPA